MKLASASNATEVYIQNPPEKKHLGTTKHPIASLCSWTVTAVRSGGRRITQKYGGMRTQLDQGPVQRIVPKKMNGR
jgi:hypothetical protein